MLHLTRNLVQLYDLATLGILLLSSVGYVLWLRRSKSKLPPGPKGTPFIGIQLFDHGLKDFEEWGKEYGEIMHLNAFGQGGIVLLNSHAAAVDLLDRRGGDYKYRPRFIAVNEFLTRGLFLTSTTDDELWRKMRRVGHECMNKTAVHRYYDIQQREALIFTENLLRDSTNWYQEVHRATISGVLSALYDIPPTLSWDDPLITKLNEFDKIVLYAGYPGSYLVEYLTWMRYLPAAIAPWKRKANEIFNDYSALFMRLFRDVETKLEAGDAMPGLVGHSIRQRERLGLSDLEASWIPAAFSNGGLATAESQLWIFPAMLCFPEAQRKCQEELDAVVGRSRTPTLSDKENLPYMRATVRELLRWRAIAPIGVPRVNKKGPDVDDFNPDRFIDENGKLLPAIADTKDGHLTYGFGPRLCPGRHYANDTMFITIAQLLWAATISPATDEKTGKPIIPDPMDTIGVTIRPRPFPCVIKPRFPEAAEMVSQAKEVLG
ncbi:hypothetical protein CVT25_010541 [Psilocybe cyanescens]|uniref:Cytochrome P450 n=1 Tax=Psilocybe cyanescens TaxID=93625 RepID=A0A409WJE3_PSICY|nr:hypothetical protein CVT25_010541 [Psilocybe cyanescens]